MIRKIQKFNRVRNEQSISKAISSSIHYAKEKISKALRTRISVLTRNQLKKESNKVYNFSKSEEISIKPLESTIDYSEYNRKKISKNTFKLEKPFVAEIEGRILPQSGICSTRDHRILLDSHKSWKSSAQSCVGARFLYYQLKSYLVPSNTKEYDFECALPLTGINTGTGSNYWSWLHAYLTRIEGLRHYEKVTGKKPDIIIPENPPEWVLESLKLHGYSDRIKYWDPEKRPMSKI